MAKKRDEEAPLTAIRLALKDHAVILEPFVNQVSALPVDDQLEYYFVPMQHMSFYKPYYRPGQPFKNLKLVNYQRPAIALSFYRKHKYKMDRNVGPIEAMNHLKERRDELLNLSMMGPLSQGQQDELRQTDTLLRTIRQEPEGYQFCLSNYHHYYHYWYCTFRYFEDEEKTQNSSDNEHLLKHTERVKGQVHERLNIIFIDPYYITRQVPYDNKLIDRELETYPHKFRNGITTLYVRKN